MHFCRTGGLYVKPALELARCLVTPVFPFHLLLMRQTYHLIVSEIDHVIVPIHSCNQRKKSLASVLCGYAPLINGPLSAFLL